MEEDRIGKICLGFAYVPHQEKAYDPELKNVLENLDKAYNEYVSANDEKELKEIRESLESISDTSGEKGKISSFFRNFSFMQALPSKERTEYPVQSEEIEMVKESGDWLVSKKEDISRFKDLIRQRYNREAHFLYCIGSSLRKINRMKEIYLHGMERTGPEIERLCNDYGDKGKLGARLEKLVDEKEKKEKKKFSPDERRYLLQGMFSAGEKDIEDISTAYLQMKHDSWMARNYMTSYSQLANSNEKIITSLNEVVESSCSQLAEIESVLNVYQISTREQVLQLSEGTVPGNLIEKVNYLSEQIEGMDKRFGQEVLKKLFRTEQKVIAPYLDDTVPGLAKEIREREND